MLKRSITKMSETATRFTGDRRGNFGILATLVTPMLLIASGVAINLAHLYNVKANMSQTLDAALTSTTREVIANGRSRDDAIRSMNVYLAANGNSGLSETDRLELRDLTIDPTARSVSADLYADVQLPFSLFGLAKSMPVSVTASTAYTDRPVEVAMMLDLTGSMNDPGTRKNGRSQTKLDNLKDAAAQAVTDLLSRNQPGMNPRVRVALIPYSQGVNTGLLSSANYIEDATIPIDPLGLDILDNPRTRLEKQIKAKQDALRTVSGMDKCTTERRTSQGAANFGEAPPSEATVNRALDFQAAVTEARRRNWPNPCPSAAIVPLSADKEKLLDAISAFSGGGGTAGHIGVQWTRYLLSPKWSGFLRQKAGAQAVPGNYGAQGTSVRKVAILLTDGEFNTAYASGGSSASFAQAHCTAMKQNIEVFTIGFMLEDETAKTTMANCASPDEAGGIRHYYDASTAEELNAAFQAIAANTELVRLSN